MVSSLPVYWENVPKTESCKRPILFLPRILQRRYVLVRGASSRQQVCETHARLALALANNNNNTADFSPDTRQRGATSPISGILFIVHTTDISTIILLRCRWVDTVDIRPQSHPALQLAVDLLQPNVRAERRRHKLKRLVQHPNSYFMDVKVTRNKIRLDIT